MLPFSLFRPGAEGLRQQVRDVRGAREERAQHVALPLLHRPHQGEGPHRVHGAGELRP